jgi:hypothetical protein
MAEDVNKLPGQQDDLHQVTLPSGLRLVLRDVSAQFRADWLAILFEQIFADPSFEQLRRLNPSLSLEDFEFLVRWATNPLFEKNGVYPLAQLKT